MRPGLKTTTLITAIAAAAAISAAFIFPDQQEPNEASESSQELASKTISPALEGLSWHCTPGQRYRYDLSLTSKISLQYQNQSSAQDMIVGFQAELWHYCLQADWDNDHFFHLANIHYSNDLSRRSMTPIELQFTRGQFVSDSVNQDGYIIPEPPPESSKMLWRTLFEALFVCPGKERNYQCNERYSSLSPDQTAIYQKLSEQLWQKKLEAQSGEVRVAIVTFELSKNNKDSLLSITHSSDSSQQNKLMQSRARSELMLTLKATDHFDAKMIDRYLNGPASETNPATLQATKQKRYQIEDIDELLASKDPNAYINLKMWLRQSRDTLPQQEILERLNRLPADDQQFLHWVRALTKQSDGQSQAVLAQFLEQEQPVTVKSRTIISALQINAAPTPQTLQRIKKLAEDGEHPYRGNAMLSLGSLGQKLPGAMDETAAFLLQQLEQSQRGSDLNLLLHAIYALGNLGSEATLHALTELGRHHHEEVRAAAIFALRNIPGGWPIILKTITGRPNTDQQAALRTLRSIEFSPTQLLELVDHSKRSHKTAGGVASRLMENQYLNRNATLRQELGALSAALSDADLRRQFKRWIDGEPRS